MISIRQALVLGALALALGSIDLNTARADLTGLLLNSQGGGTITPALRPPGQAPGRPPTSQPLPGVPIVNS